MFFAEKKRIEQLERRCEELESNVTSLSLHVAELKKKCAELEQQSETVSAGSLIQQGIDNIMGFQWPPAKGGER